MKEHIWILINYMETSEVEGFTNWLKENGFQEELPTDDITLMKFMELNNLTDHVLYSILKIKQELNNEETSKQTTQ